MKYKCTKCGELKQDSEFYSYNGIRKGSCKKCDCEYSKRYRERLDIEFYGDWIEEINAIAWNKRENALFKSGNALLTCNTRILFDSEYGKSLETSETLILLSRSDSITNPAVQASGSALVALDENRIF